MLITIKLAVLLEVPDNLDDQPTITDLNFNVVGQDTETPINFKCLDYTNINIIEHK